MSRMESTGCGPSDAHGGIGIGVWVAEVVAKPRIHDSTGMEDATHRLSGPESCIRGHGRVRIGPNPCPHRHHGVMGDLGGEESALADGPIEGLPPALGSGDTLGDGDGEGDGDGATYAGPTPIVHAIVSQ